MYFHKFPAILPYKNFNHNDDLHTIQEIFASLVSIISCNMSNVNGVWVCVAFCGPRTFYTM